MKLGCKSFGEYEEQIKKVLIDTDSQHIAAHLALLYQDAYNALRILLILNHGLPEKDLVKLLNQTHEEFNQIYTDYFKAIFSTDIKPVFESIKNQAIVFEDNEFQNNFTVPEDPKNHSKISWLKKIVNMLFFKPWRKERNT